MRAILALFLAFPVYASCGSTSCPIDLRALQIEQQRGFSLDLSFQSIDQDQPRIGSRKASVGALPSDHDEVRTRNRITTLQLGYAPNESFRMSVSAPYVARAHEHIDAESHESDHWNFRGVGDVMVDTRYRVASSLWLTAGVKLPAGTRRERSAGGEDAEVTITPGTGSTDAIVGAAWQSSILRDTALEGPMGHTTRIPYFAGASLRVNGRGTGDYRRGNEVQLNAGTEYPLTNRLHVLAQLNGRISSKDDPGSTGEERELTGGRYLFASPGLRLSGAAATSLYAYVQIPVYQHVNGLQLTARANYVAGVHRTF